MNFKTTVEREKDELRNLLLDLGKKGEVTSSGAVHLKAKYEQAMNRAALATIEMIEALPDAEITYHGSITIPAKSNASIATLKASLTTQE